MDETQKQIASTAEGVLEIPFQVPRVRKKVAWKTTCETVTRGVFSLLKVAFVVAAGAAFLYSVWPTPYLYRHGNVNGIPSVLLRVNRFTGKTESFLNGKWGLPAQRKIEDIYHPTLTGWAGFEGYNNSSWGGTVYNSGPYTVTSFVVEITAKSGGKEKWKREYRIEATIPPLTAHKFSIPVLKGFEADDQEWSIVSAKGYLQE